MADRKAIRQSYYGKNPLTFAEYLVAVPRNPNYVVQEYSLSTEYYTKTQCNTVFVLVEYTISLHLYKMHNESDHVIMRSCKNQERMKELFPEIVMAHSL